MPSITKKTGPARGRHVWQVVVSAEAAFLGHGFSGWQRQVNSKTMYGEGTRSTNIFGHFT